MSSYFYSNYWLHKLIIWWTTSSFYKFFQVGILQYLHKLTYIIFKRIYKPWVSVVRKEYFSACFIIFLFYKVSYNIMQASFFAIKGWFFNYHIIIIKQRNKFEVLTDLDGICFKFTPLIVFLAIQKSKSTITDFELQKTAEILNLPGMFLIMYILS